MAEITPDDVARANRVALAIFGDLISEGSAEFQAIAQEIANARAGEPLPASEPTPEAPAAAP
jgi:hypothetical protein